MISTELADQPSATPTSPTLSTIIRQAAMELDGIGLNDRILLEATSELERNLQRVAALALRKVLQNHLAQLTPVKKTRKSLRHTTKDVPEALA